MTTQLLLIIIIIIIPCHLSLGLPNGLFSSSLPNESPILATILKLSVTSSTDNKYVDYSIHYTSRRQQQHFSKISNQHDTLRISRRFGELQGCTNPGCQVAQATEFCTVTANICRSSVWNLLHANLLAPKLLTWLPDFRNILLTPGPLCSKTIDNLRTTKN